MTTRKLTSERKIEAVLRVLAGELTIDEAAEEKGVAPADIEEWKTFYLHAALNGLHTRSAKPSLRQRVVASIRRSPLRAAALTLAACMAFFWSSTVLSQAMTCDSHDDLIVCFTAGTPAKASDVDNNFAQIIAWLEQKVGAVGSSDVDTSGDLKVGTDLTPKNTEVSGTLDVGGNVGMDGDLTVSGSTTITRSCPPPGVDTRVYTGRAGFCHTSSAKDWKTAEEAQETCAAEGAAVCTVGQYYEMAEGLTTGLCGKDYSATEFRSCWTGHMGDASNGIYVTVGTGWGHLLGTTHRPYLCCKNR